MEYHFISNVREEPEAVRRTAERSLGPIREICARLKLRGGFDLILMTGCGSSNHAAVCAEHAFHTLVKTPVKVMPSSEIVLHPEGFLDARKLVVVISRSGEKGDSLGAARKAKAEGATVVAVTAGASSLLAQTADEVILTHEGPEHSQPKTKSVLTAIEALVLFAIEYSDHPDREKLSAGARQAADALVEVIARYDGPMKVIARKHRRLEDLLLGGSGPHFGTAVEAALKIKETCNIHSEAMSTGEVAQGPILVLDKKWLYLTFVSGAGSDHAIKMLRGARFKKAATMVLTPDPEKVADLADYVIAMPKLDSELFMPIVYLAPLHLLTYWLSQERGLDADDPKDFDMVLELILEPGRHEPEMA